MSNLQEKAGILSKDRWTENGKGWPPVGEGACVGRHDAGSSESLKAWETDRHPHIGEMMCRKQKTVGVGLEGPWALGEHWAAMLCSRAQGE